MNRPLLVLLSVAALSVVALVAWPGLAPAAPVEPSPTPRVQPSRHPVTIREPLAPRVRTGALDRRGEPVEVQCSVCHSSRAPNPNTTAEDLDEFHQGLRFAHGSGGCLSCHDSRSYDALHLAGGESLPFTQSIRLCGQCHGPQLRDYRHGAHGGMRGYWDLTRGPRVRNHCVDCHDPHAPAYPKVRPVFPPQKEAH